MNSIPVDRYAEQIHLFEPWTPPADSKEEPLSKLLDDAIHELEKSIASDICEKYNAILKNKKSLLYELLELWNPEADTLAYDKVTRALCRMRHPRRVIQPDSPPFLFYSNYLIWKQIRVDVAAEKLSPDATVPAYVKKAGPQVQLDLQTICGCIGRELQPCEAVAVRGYCLSAKYLTLSVPFQWGDFSQKALQTKIEQYYANVFRIVRELGCSSILLSSLFSEEPKQTIASLEFEILIRELKRSPKLKHVLIRTEDEKIDGYNKLIEDLGKDEKLAREGVTNGKQH